MHNHIQMTLTLIHPFNVRTKITHVTSGKKRFHKNEYSPDFFSGVYNNSFQSSKSGQMLKADYPVYKNWELVSMWV
ncbi:Uncharacterized protein APZ42_023561 [Daphnia magna]|uniref:Uncharacterized protein n=1 Tax=Daphnia magna TaxID=35525 RepID=A0A162DH07_9CRUS|nr:Uncharacterized protein APZ42_023561 [Daphnia magna]